MLPAPQKKLAHFVKNKKAICYLCNNSFLQQMIIFALNKINGPLAQLVRASDS